MDDKERQELIETIKTRVEVWENKEYRLSDGPKVELKTGNRNKYFVDRVTINDDKLRLIAYDDPMYIRKLALEQLTDDSLEIISLALPLTFTIFVTAFKDVGKREFEVYSTPVRANFVPEDLEKWLKKNFPLLDWEPNDSASFICYTERTDNTGPYLLAELVYSEG